MYFKQLAQLLPVQPQLWSSSQVAIAASMAGLQEIASDLERYKFDGSTLLKLNDQNLKILGIKSQILCKRLLNWARVELLDYISYLQFDHQQDYFQQKLEKQVCKQQKQVQRLQQKQKQLLLVQICQQNRVLIIGKEEVTIGRCAECHIRLSSTLISRNHAKFMRQPSGSYCYLDLQSTSGSYLRIKKATAVNSLSLLAGQCFLQFQLIAQSCLLRVMRQNQETKQIVLDLKECDQFVVGRLKSAKSTQFQLTPRSLGLPDPTLSRNHFRASRNGSQLTVEDLGSTNGTYQRVKRADLGQVQLLRLGNANLRAVKCYWRQRCQDCGGKTSVFRCGHSQLCLNCAGQICKKCKAPVQIVEEPEWLLA